VFNALISCLCSHEDDPFSELAEAGGDEFMAVKPWLGAIKCPSNPPPTSDSPPDADLELEWVHGYRSQDSRNNLRYSSDGRIVYHAAALGITMDPIQGRVPGAQLFNEVIEGCTMLCWGAGIYLLT
jgi:hypothetical protein